MKDLYRLITITSSVISSNGYVTVGLKRLAVTYFKTKPLNLLSKSLQLLTVIHGNSIEVLKGFEPESIDFVFTSPSPFGYGDKNGGIGSETDREDYLHNLNLLFEEIYRVLKYQGSCWVQLADHHIDGELVCIPERLAIDLQQSRWLLRSKCIWVRTEKFDYQEDYNRFARDVEHLYFFTKTKDHYFNNPSQKVQSSVFYADYKPPKQEFASGFPEKIIERCISLTCPPKGVILDPLADACTTAVVAKRMGREYIMIDISYEKVLAAKARLGEK